MSSSWHVGKVPLAGSCNAHAVSVFLAVAHAFCAVQTFDYFVRLVLRLVDVYDRGYFKLLPYSQHVQPPRFILEVFQFSRVLYSRLNSFCRGASESC